MAITHVTVLRKTSLPSCTKKKLDSLVLLKAPALDPAWIQYEKEADLLQPRRRLPPLERQPIFAAECRALHAQLMAPGARDFCLSQGIATRDLTVPSTRDGFPIPVIRYELLSGEACSQPRARETEECKDSGHHKTTIVIYYHGGGLLVGEADSEDLSCRRILKECGLAGPVVLFSVGYRLMPRHPASTCLADSLDAFASVRAAHPGARVVVVGSSSGGQLAALISQAAPRGSVDGVVLRCPVTSDAFNGADFVPERVRHMHTSAWDLSFTTSLHGAMLRKVPRDGLERMPLEAHVDDLRGLPRTWIQLCSNDTLYSDGLCYAKLLEDAGVDVQVHVVRGWPHTFWLKAPHLPQALDADRAMLRGLAWVAD